MKRKSRQHGFAMSRITSALIHRPQAERCVTELHEVVVSGVCTFWPLSSCFVNPGYTAGEIGSSDCDSELSLDRRFPIRGKCKGAQVWKCLHQCFKKAVVAFDTLCTMEHHGQQRLATFVLAILLAAGPCDSTLRVYLNNGATSHPPLRFDDVPANYDFGPRIPSKVCSLLRSSFWRECSTSQSALYLILLSVVLTTPLLLQTYNTVLRLCSPQLCTIDIGSELPAGRYRPA